MERELQLKRSHLQTVDGLLVGKPSPPEDSIFKSDVDGPKFGSIDELVVAGNQSFANLDLIDFATLRNDKELAAKVLDETREHLKQLHPEGEGKAFNEDLRRVLHARYLQGHGVQVQAHLDGAELVALRKFFQVEGKAANVADAARAMNQALAGGEQNVESLLRGAEVALFAERGVSAQTFQEKYAGFDVKTLKEARDYVDYYGSSESGKFLTQAQGEDFATLRESMARQMLAERGFTGLENLDLKTVQTLLWDTDNEGPISIATYREAVSKAAEAGETNYFKLNMAGNEAILGELGVSPKLLKKLKVNKEQLKTAYPDYDATEMKADRIRVLRDLLRVLPDSERAAAIISLETADTDLLRADSTLSRFFADRIEWHSNGQVETKGIGAMQRANMVSGLAKLPDDVKKEVFKGPVEQVVRRMELAVEDEFGVEVHRKSGTAPTEDQSYGPYTQDWTVQGLADLYNGLSAMAKGGKLPPGISGTTTVSFMVGSPETPEMVPLKLHEEPEDPHAPFDRPGDGAHAVGESGFYGEASAPKDGHDNVILCDDALYDNNSVGIVGQTLGERTIIHEFGHAVQLGGTPDAGTDETRQAETQKNMAEWSSLSRWTEPDNLLADGRQGDYEYYYDAGVKVQSRREVSTSYGATDPCEDFAEYVPFFFSAPATAMALSAEKFTYTNKLMGDFYSSDEMIDVAMHAGMKESDLMKAELHMLTKVAKAPAEAGLVSA